MLAMPESREGAEIFGMSKRHTVAAAWLEVALARHIGVLA